MDTLNTRKKFPSFILFHHCLLQLSGAMNQRTEEDLTLSHLSLFLSVFPQLSLHNSDFLFFFFLAAVIVTRNVHEYSFSWACCAIRLGVACDMMYTGKCEWNNMCGWMRLCIQRVSLRLTQIRASRHTSCKLFRSETEGLFNFLNVCVDELHSRAF